MSARNKKEELTDQRAVFQERGHPRWGSAQFPLKTGITIQGFEGEGLLANFCVSGCSLESVTFIALIPNEEYQAKIIPAENENMEPFNLRIKLNWIKSSEALFQAGFSLGEGQSNAQLKRYGEILQARGIVPDLGNKYVT